MVCIRPVAAALLLPLGDLTPAMGIGGGHACQWCWRSNGSCGSPCGPQVCKVGEGNFLNGANRREQRWCLLLLSGCC